MARPTKQGVDYFPLDCTWDDKTEMYLLETESDGLSTLVNIWQIIYSNHGYFIENGEDLLLLIKKRINLDPEITGKCVEVALKRGIFDITKHKKFGILTSKAIQKRYFEAAKRKKLVEYDRRYIINGVDVCNNSVNVLHLSANVKGKGKGEEEVKVKGKGKGEEEVKVKGKGKGEEEVKGEVKRVHALWNFFAESYGLSKCLEFTDTRISHLIQRMKESKFDFKNILMAAEQQSFLLGDNKRKWGMDIDFILESKTKYIKILEGGYGKKGKLVFSREQEQKYNEALERIFESHNKK